MEGGFPGPPVLKGAEGMIPPISKGVRLTAVRMALAFFVALLVSCAGAPPSRDLQPRLTEEGLTFLSGLRVDREGTPVLDLSGSSYDVGLQYGVLLRPEIRSMYAEYEKLLDQLTGGGLRRFFFRLSLEGKLREMRSALPAGFEDEVRGIAEGAGIPFSDYLFFAMTPELLFDVSCTSMVVREGDTVVHGRNFDFPRPANLVWRYPVIAKVAVDGKIPYVTIGFAGLPGVYTGLNERGIAASVNTAAFTKHATANVIPVGFLVKEVLEDSSSLGDVDAIMKHSAASHYFIEVSSRDEHSAALYESLGDATAKVPMTGDVQAVANAPLSPANRHDNASILSRAEYNLAREHELGVLEAEAPQGPLADYLLKVLSNRDFYSYHDFPVHQTLQQDSFKTINNFCTIQSVIIDWPENRVIFSYRPSYAAYGPFFAYDLSTGRISPWRAEDPACETSGFQADSKFLDEVFTLTCSREMSLDRDGWEKVMVFMDQDPGMNPFLKADWTFSAALALGRFEAARQAAQWIDQAFPDYYLGPLDLGMAAFKEQNWREARTRFLESRLRSINSPATQLLAVACASVASRRCGDQEEAARLRDQARQMLDDSWVPQDFDARLKTYVPDGEVADLIRQISREAGSQGERAGQ
jgi:Acyl-coenzyme A:6-aminopenicillanic acid acyl-transferase